MYDAGLASAGHAPHVASIAVRPDLHVLPGAPGSVPVLVSLSVTSMSAERLGELSAMRSAVQQYQARPPGDTGPGSSGRRKGALSAASTLRSTPLVAFADEMGSATRLVQIAADAVEDMRVLCHPSAFVSRVTPEYLETLWAEHAATDGAGVVHVSRDLPLRLAIRGCRLLAGAVAEGVSSFLGRGPISGGPVIGSQVELTHAAWGADVAVFGKRLMGGVSGRSSDVQEMLLPVPTKGAVGGGKKSVPLASLAMAASRGLLVHGEQLAPRFGLLEPLMRATMVVGESSTGSILTEVTGTARRGTIRSISAADDTRAPGAASSAGPHVASDVTISADLPLTSLLTFSSAFRSLTSGNGSYEVRANGMTPVPSHLLPEYLKHHAL